MMNELKKEFSSLNNAIFIFSTDIDLEKTAEKFIQKETEKIGREWVKNLKKRSAEYDKTTEYGFAFQKRDSFFSQKEK